MQADVDRELAGFLDRTIQSNAMAVDFLTGFRFDPVGDVFGCDGAKGLAAFAGLENEGKLQFAEALGEVVGPVQFGGLALGTAGLERIGHAQRGRRDFVGHAAGNEKIAGVATTDFDHISLGAEARDVRGKNNFGVGHKPVGIKTKGDNGSVPGRMSITLRSIRQMNRLKKFDLQARGQIGRPVQWGQRTTIIQPVQTNLRTVLQGGFRGMGRAATGPPNGDRNTDLGQTRQGSGLETARENALHRQAGAILPGEGRINRDRFGQIDVPGIAAAAVEPALEAGGTGEIVGVNPTAPGARPSRSPHRRGSPRLKPVIRPGRMKEDEPRDKFGMLRGGQAGQGGADARRDNDRPFPAAGGTAEFMQTTRIILGAERTIGALALTEADPVGCQDAVARGEKRIDFRPLIRCGARKKIVQKHQRFPLSAHVIDDLSAGGALHAAGKDGGRNDIRQRRLRQRTPAPPQGHNRGAEQTGSESHPQTFFPEFRHTHDRKYRLLHI